MDGIVVSVVQGQFLNSIVFGCWPLGWPVNGGSFPTNRFFRVETCENRLGSKSDRAPSMAITCPGIHLPLWLASNQYGQDLEARAHKSEFAARHLFKSLLPTCFVDVWDAEPRSVATAKATGHPFPHFPEAKLWTWALGNAPTTPITRTRSIVQSFIRFRFSSGPKGAARTLTQTGLSCAAGESPFESWNQLYD